jgi:CubicO group peptidase (beta-lactamase class C family)
MRLLIILICFSQAVVLAEPLQEFTQHVEAERQRLGIPGISIAIVDKGAVKYLNFGLSHSEKSNPVTSDTLFELASISKPITATAIMRLAQLGLVSLDAPISNYIQPWNLPASGYQNDKVTLRTIMSHTAGLSGRSYQGFPVSQKLPTIEDSLNGILLASSRVEVVIEPGTQYRYSGGGFTLPS